METNTRSSQDASASSWPPTELFSNPENHQIGNPMSSENNGFLLTNQRGNQSYPNNIGSNEHMDPRSLNLLETQLQRLRIENAVSGQQHGNNTNQQTLAGPSGIGTSHVYNPYSEKKMLMGRQRYNNITSLETVRGRVVSMSKEEHGSEFLVRKLDERNPEDIKFIVMEVVKNFHELMMDHFGNRVVQKIFDAVNVNEMTRLVDLIIINKHKFRTVCNHRVGTRAIQNMIDHFTTEKQLDHFTSALIGVVVGLATSQYGGYVIQHCLKLFPNSLSKAIMDAMAVACIPIATDKVGCSVIQRCLSNAELQSSFLLIHAVIFHALVLSQDLYGNYVVQYIINLMMPTLNTKIVYQLRGKYVELSMDKHASNVVEGLLRFSTQDDVVIMVQELMNSPCFLYLLQDPYGNYVAQSAFQSSTGALRNMLVNKILQHDKDLITDPFGQKVLEFISGGKFGAQF